MGKGFHLSALPGAPYVLDEPSVLELVRLWRDIDWTAVEGNPRIATSLRWFESSYDRHRIEDRLIDFAVALEALLSESQGDIAYRLSLRTAMLLGDAAVERESIRLTIRELYQLRSKLVHGGDVRTELTRRQKDRSLPTFIGACSGLVRQAIRAHALRSKFSDKNDVIRELDAAMLAGGPRASTSSVERVATSPPSDSPG